MTGAQKPSSVRVGEEFWRERAACAAATPELFDAHDPKRARDAVRICADCPVRTRCLAARPQNVGGVWGGLVFNEHGRLSVGRGHRPKVTAA